jgi:three-Cys-motif partner protein
MPFAKRDSQTRIKHEILRSYAGAWAGIIGNGVRGAAFSADARGQRFQLDLTYVDGFGGAGRYLRDSDQAIPSGPIWGSPIIGMQALELAAADLSMRGVPTQITGIVTEKDASNFDELVENLQSAKLRTPVQVAERYSSPQAGKITVMRGDFRDHLPDILRHLGGAFVLAFIDPYGPAMPMELLARLVGRPKTDAITLFPVEDLDRKAGSFLKAETQQTPQDRGNITRTTSHFGSEEWKEIADKTHLPSEVRRAMYAKLYDQRLRTIDPTLWVKNIALRFSGLDRTVHNFFLTTRDADGAMRMNDILRGATIAEFFAVWRDAMERQRQREEDSLQESLFGSLDVTTLQPPTPEQFQVDIATVEEAILTSCPRDRDLEKKQVLGYLADTPFVESEITKALRNLKARGLVSFGTLDRRGGVIRVLP